MNFEFTAPQRVIFGPGAIRQVGALAAGFGRRALAVTGRDVERAAPVLEQLRAQGVAATVFAVAGEPTVAGVGQGAAQAVRIAAELVVACGGGSPLDAAKAIAALATNGGQPLDYMEVVGRGQPLAKPSLPLIAIPTTAGTGSEVTRNAVLTSPEHGVKASMRSFSMVPRIAVFDPELTYGLPPAVTASTGLDALTQLVEPYVCNRTNPLVDALCREGLGRVARSLRRAWSHGRDAAAREDMALASLFGGFALANAGLGAVHGFSGVIGGMFRAPHGAVCAALLPHVMAVNRRALQERAPDSPLAARYEEVARLLTGNPAASAEEGVAWVARLARDLEVPSLAACGVKAEHVPLIVERAAVASGTKANPIELTRAELAEILRRAI
mgnify:FL=1